MSLDPTLYPPISPVTGDAPRPFWSVIVPAYKSKYLSKALHSVVDQAPPPEQMEIIVINDCSPEDLDPIVSEAGGQRVHYIKQPENRGTYPTENHGVTIARGQWIHILNDDDWVLKGFYDALQKSLQYQPERIAAAFTGFTHVDEDGKEHSTPPPMRGAPGVIPDFIEQMGISNRVHPIAIVFRRLCFEKLGGFNLNLNYCADWEFNKRVAVHYDWWCEPKVLACYRMNSESVSATTVKTGQQMRDLRYAIELSERYLPADRCERISRTSREHYALFALRVANQALKQHLLSPAILQIKEAIRMSQAPHVLQRLSEMMTTPPAAPLREAMVDFFARLEAADAPGDEPRSESKPK